MAQFILGANQQGKPTVFNLAMANRHGLIAGSTGTGKTVTLQLIAEQFAKSGVNVFAADVKGDLSGIALPAEDNPKLKQRLTDINIQNFTPVGNPVVFWDIYGKNGHPLRTTISEMGPLLLGRLLDLNTTQQGVLNAAFAIADDEGLLLLDLKDLNALLDWMGKNATTLKTQYGNMTTSSLGAIQRGLLTLNTAGGDTFFAEPAFNVQHLFEVNSSGKGTIHILDATKLITDARLYSTFLLWLLSELFETAPEVGDLEKPKLAFFFDEAHLFFDSAPKPLLEKIEQLVRLIRSKGIGVYFISQNPMDVPESILGQLGNRVQHAMRAFTPKDQKAVKTAAATFRQNPEFNTGAMITQLPVGEALVSLLDESGTPGVVDAVKIYPPTSHIGALTAAQRQSIMNNSPYAGKYDAIIDRESAYERISQKINNEFELKIEKPKTTQRETAKKPAAQPRGRPRQSTTETIFKATARSMGTQIGRQIVRGLLGSIFRK